ncbi:hypothetical protein CVT24_004576 [Panaeolus cyanescens]|uniref:CUE domain-containing protein n=1 Tax=Panaeolus cyanescens TaxID=181874 RepID=A0A409VA41_9AGAR|nr:hypothetical protein CVT24_004576 [Panaeolus cyanescens]
MTDNIAAGSANPSSPSNNEVSASSPVSTPSVPPVTQQNSSPSTPQPAPEPEQPSDPRIVGLKAMFPDYDDLVLLSVLDSVGGNQDRAIDMLLAMSDPNYKSEAPPAAGPNAQSRPALTQEELDEQFARSLVMQEQQEQQAWLQANQGGQRPPTVYQSGRPNQTWSPPGQSTSPQSTQADKTMQDIQEQFTKIAETGKKTFGNIFSKVKAKIQEFDQGRPVPSSSNPESSQRWSPPSAAPTSPNVQSSAAYYDPNPTPVQAQQPIAASPPCTSPPITTTTNKGYDVGDDSLIPAASSPPTVKSTSPPLAAEATSSIAPPPATNSGAPIDAGKFGLLPKKPVSLLPQSSATSGPASNNIYDSDDDLEYAENPFDDAQTSTNPAPAKK